MDASRKVDRRCLRCDKRFESIDRKRNWICPKCRSNPDPYTKPACPAPDHWEVKHWRDLPGWAGGV
jgi:tRNA(Ile2) C34 agmatinyltransferase TiaS